MAFRINKFRIPFLVLPIRCFHEVVEGFLDIMSLFRLFSKKPYSIALMVQLFIAELQDYGSLDLIDIDVLNKNERVKIKFLMR